MPNSEPERPRSEPEIIPPGRAHEDDIRRVARRWEFQDEGGYRHGSYRRIYAGRIGPFGMFLIALAGAALSILLLVFLAWTFLIFIPVIGVIVLAAIFSGRLRRLFHRPR